MVMKICDCGEEVESVAARVSGAQNICGQKTSIEGPQYFHHWRDKEQIEKKMHSMATFGPTVRVLWEVNPRLFLRAGGQVGACIRDRNTRNMNIHEIIDDQATLFL